MSQFLPLRRRLSSCCAPMRPVLSTSAITPVFARAIPGAFHLTNESLATFLQQTDPDRPVVVMCYHGHTAVGVAQYLVNHGFETVYNLDGGFAAWQLASPVVRSGDADQEIPS